MTLFEHIVDLRWILNNIVAFSCASRDNLSSPDTMTSFLVNSRIDSTTVFGSRSLLLNLLSLKIFCEFRIIRCMLHGRATFVVPRGKICRTNSRSRDNWSNSSSITACISELLWISFTTSSWSLLRRFLSDV